MLSFPAVLDVVGWLACMAMSWPSLLTAQHSASSTTGATANFWAKPSHSKEDKQGTVDWHSCCCHRRY